MSSSSPPPLAKHKPKDLPRQPSLDDLGLSLDATYPASKPHLDSATDLDSLTAAQLYDLNQNLVNESISTAPLINTIEPMSALRKEYENGSQKYLQQIDWLHKKGYQFIRRTRGDGDCFYRSIGFAYVERLMLSPDPTTAVARSIAILQGTLNMLDEAGFQRMVFEDFFEEFISLVRAVIQSNHQGSTLTPQRLLELFQLPEVSNSIVVYLRLATSAQIRKDPSEYEPFLIHPDFGEPLSVRDFCEGFVEASGKEADHVQMIALSRALQTNIDVAYLDGRSDDGVVEFVTFRNAPHPNDMPINLLYRPGHYDILTAPNPV